MPAISKAARVLGICLMMIWNNVIKNFRLYRSKNIKFFSFWNGINDFLLYLLRKYC